MEKINSWENLESKTENEKNADMRKTLNKKRTWKTNLWEEDKSEKNSDPKQTNKKEKKTAKRKMHRKNKKKG